MKKRLLFYKVAKYFEAKEAIIITGMRQVGKTTLLNQIYGEIGEAPKLWFDFDNPLEQKMFEDLDYEAIYKRLSEKTKRGKLYVFIDEIQNFPEITKIIKVLIDHHQVKFFVTGSSNYYMKNLFPESLSGRKFLFNLSPLAFQEYLYFKDQKSLNEIIELDSKNIEALFLESNIFDHKKYEPFYQQSRKPRLLAVDECFSASPAKRDERSANSFAVKLAEKIPRALPVELHETFLEFGGFPEVVVTDDLGTKKLILTNIFKSFFEKDIKILSDYSEVKELRDLLKEIQQKQTSLSIKNTRLKQN